MIGGIIYAVVFFAMTFFLGYITKDPPCESYEELAWQNPLLDLLLIQLAMYALGWLAVLDYPEIAFKVIMALSIAEWLLLILRRPECWGGSAFANFGIDVLAVLVLAERTGQPRCLGTFFGH